MDKLEKEAKKKRSTDVYSNTYDNGGWSKRDALPTGDPIGDVVEEESKDKKPKADFAKWIEDTKKYNSTMRGRLIVPQGKDLNIKAEDFYGFPEIKKCCEKPQKYKNIISNNLKFWACRNCGADLGDVE